jgi:hypothetical protein
MRWGQTKDRINRIDRIPNRWPDNPENFVNPVSYFPTDARKSFFRRLVALKSHGCGSESAFKSDYLLDQLKFG